MAKRETDGERHTRMHNKGEQDAHDNNYDPPHNWLAETTFANEKERDDCAAYREGWKNGRK